MTAREVRELARRCGFELAGVAPASPSPDFCRYRDWANRGLAGAMRYLTDHRAAVRSDPRNLLASARSVISVGKLYDTPQPYSTTFMGGELAWISRYAWGDDYHDVLRRGLEQLAALLGPDHEHRVCVDTAPLLERSWARAAGLGWIGKNTCLINQQIGSWLFLGELLTSLEIEIAPANSPPPDRCGTCTRCIDACPTQALTPYQLDATRCISYFTIELRGPIPDQFHAAMGAHVFGCDICQEVCPWNRRAPFTEEPAFAPRHFAPPLARMAALSEEEFRDMFRGTPVTRARYAGFQRNVAVAIRNARSCRDAHEPPREREEPLPSAARS
jgi:epoxyqueuosine reductase